MSKSEFSLLIILYFISFNLRAQQHTILIIADDVSPDYFGCFSPNTDTANTPNIRLLAERGVKFSKVWASPVCSPTRAGIFTGRYPFRTGVGQVISNATSPQLDTAEMSIAEMLRAYSPLQYNTACFGKWHLHANIPSQRLFPNQMGFNYYSGNFNGAINNYYGYPVVTNGIVDSVTIYATTQTINDAIAWLDTINSSNPFFLWIAFNAPHTPFHIPPSTLCNTSGLTGTTQDINANPENYFKASIEAMDTELGRLFQYLTTNNLMDSTNIIFIGDNGNTTQVAQIVDQTKSKGTLYDYGVRVPMVIAGPCVVNPNRTSDKLINTPDLFATIAEICGFNSWNNIIPQGVTVDSKSFLHVLKNQNGYDRTWIFTEQFNDPVNVNDGKTIRNENYHLIRNINGTEEFYNQTIDIEENTNLLTGIMTPTDVSNYNFLCDTLTSLTSTGSCTTVSIDNLFLDENIYLFPNPANEMFEIHADLKIANINLYSAISGYRNQYVNSTIRVDDLPPGIYFVEITFTNGFKANRKLVVEK